MEVAMRMVVTGGAGFIGATLVKRQVAAGRDVVTVDKLTYAGRIEALDEVVDAANHRFVQADIADAARLRAIIGECAPDIVFHLAAESHVDRSIDDPAAFVSTNIVGTYVLLEAALDYWKGLPAHDRERFRFVHVSSDEVFGALEDDDAAFDAASPYRPNSPYAASKAASDHLARAWHRSYGLPVIVTNCSNAYGPYQHSEKLIPTVIRHALNDSPIPVYGSGRQSRDWIHVDDVVAGLDAAARRGLPGESYLFGAGNRIRNIDLVDRLCALLDRRRDRQGSHAELVRFVTDRPGHDHRYAVDPTATEAALGWTAQVPLETGLAATVDWYLSEPAWLEPPSRLGRLGLLRAPAETEGDRVP